MKELSGISLSVKVSGDAYLTFTASNGGTAAINMTALADRSGPITNAAIRQWIEDNKHNVEAEASERDS